MSTTFENSVKTIVQERLSTDKNFKYLCEYFRNIEAVFGVFSFTQAHYGSTADLLLTDSGFALTILDADNFIINMSNIALKKNPHISTDKASAEIVAEGTCKVIIGYAFMLAGLLKFATTSMSDPGKLWDDFDMCKQTNAAFVPVYFGINQDSTCYTGITMQTNHDTIQKGTVGIQIEIACDTLRDLFYVTNPITTIRTSTLKITFAVEDPKHDLVDTAIGTLSDLKRLTKKRV